MKTKKVGASQERRDIEARNRESLFVVLVERKLLWAYGYDHAIPGGGDSKDWTVGDVIKDLVGSSAVDSVGGGDLTVWRAGRILAVIRRGPDGRPEVTRFDGAGASQFDVVHVRVVPDDAPPRPIRSVTVLTADEAKFGPPAPYRSGIPTAFGYEQMEKLRSKSEAMIRDGHRKAAEHYAARNKPLGTTAHVSDLPDPNEVARRQIEHQAKLKARAAERDRQGAAEEST